MTGKEAFASYFAVSKCVLTFFSDKLFRTIRYLALEKGFLKIKTKLFFRKIICRFDYDTILTICNIRYLQQPTKNIIIHFQWFWHSAFNHIKYSVSELLVRKTIRWGHLTPASNPGHIPRNYQKIRASALILASCTLHSAQWMHTDSITSFNTR